MNLDKYRNNILFHDYKHLEILYWPVEKINTFLPLMCNTNIDEFINSAINNNNI